MGERWESVPLDELVEEIIDRRGVTPLKLGSDFVPSGHRVISAKLIKGGRIDLTADEPRFVGPAVYRRWMRTPLFADDVILTSEAPLGEVAYVDQQLDWCLGQRLFGVRTKKSRMVGRFLYYALQSESVRSDLLSRASGTTVLGIRQTELRRVLVPVPNIDQQRSIAEILGALDDKIELNRRMNETLEAMARALFKSWFIDFDPVHAKVKDLVEDGVLEIGDGYRAKNSEMGTPGLPFVRAGDLDGGFNTSSAEMLGEASVEKAGSKVSRPGDVAFTSKGTIGRFARVTRLTDPFVYSPQVCFWRSVDPKKLDPGILYCWMQSEDLRRQIEAVAGQTDMAPYVSLRDQREMEIPVFPESQSTVAAQIRPVLARQDLLTTETRTLASLRDTLLPKLLSGELQVRRSIGGRSA